MASEVDICNIALSNIRAGSISSLTEKSSQAQYCKLKYPFIRDMLLTDVPWNFSHKVDVLAVLADVDVFNWVYSYQYPSDCLHVNKLILNFEEFGSTGDGVTRSRHIEDVYSPDLERQVKYKVFNVDNNRVIGANEPGLKIDYRMKITDPNLFDNLFIQTFSWLMSAELSVPLVGAETGRQLRADALTMYNKYLNEAVANNMNESYTEPRDSEFINAYR